MMFMKDEIRYKLINNFSELLYKYRESQQSCIYEGLSGRDYSEEHALANLEVEIYLCFKKYLRILNTDRIEQ